MVDWKQMTQKVQGIVKQRGGPKSVEEDAKEVQGISKEDASMSTKAKETAEAIKEPGAPGSQQGQGGGQAQQ